MTVKTCSKCQEQKPVAAFSADARRKDGRCSRCKTCASAAYRDWYMRHADAEIARTTAWQRENPGRVREYNARKRINGRG